MGHHSTQDIFVRKSSTDLPNTVYCFVTEGQCTEPDYFENLVHMMKPHVYCDYLKKEGIDSNNTARKQVIQLAYAYADTRRKGRRNPLLLITDVFNQYYARHKSEFSETKLERFRDHRMRVFNNLSTRYKSRDIPTGVVIQFASEQINRNYHPNEPFVFIPTDDQLDEGFSDTRNIFAYAMYDRDLLCDVGLEDYSDNVALAKQFGVELIVTTPNFELWLLLHHANLDYDKVSSMPVRGSKYDPESVGIQDCLISLESDCVHDAKGMKHIDSKRFKVYYRDNISRAISAIDEHPECFVKDIDSLAGQYGSNFGTFLKNVLRDEHLPG